MKLIPPACFLVLRMWRVTPRPSNGRWKRRGGVRDEQTVDTEAEAEAEAESSRREYALPAFASFCLLTQLFQQVLIDGMVAPYWIILEYYFGLYHLTNELLD